MQNNCTYQNVFPRFVANLSSLMNNTLEVLSQCDIQDVEVAAVIKGFNGIDEVVTMFDQSDCKHIASSRIPHLKRVKELGVTTPTLLIRTPMLSEIHSVVNYADISLNTENETLKQLDVKCSELSTTHSVILMLDLGDLREGHIDKDSFIKQAIYVEKELENIKLMGIGTNLGCYGSIKPTPENLGQLVNVAEKIESFIGRELEIISGGATSSYPLVLNGTMPKRVNHLRIGEGILLARDLNDYWNIKLDNMKTDTFFLDAEVVEVNTKPTYPIGEIAIDAFGNTPTYTDNGNRKRAILGVGKQDFGDFTNLIPTTDGLKFIGSSSDHLIIDIEDVAEDIKLGDILRFEMYYPAMLYLSGYKGINVEVIK